MAQYVKINDLLENGGENCTILNDRPTDGLYLVLIVDPMANCGRGLNALYFKRTKIAGEFQINKRWGYSLDEPSIGLFNDAKEKIEEYIVNKRLKSQH